MFWRHSLYKKLFKFNKYIVFLFLISFLQYSSQHIFDLGQLSFQCTSIFIFYYLIKKFFEQYKIKKFIYYGISMGLLLSFGLWIRLSYSFLYPSIFIITSVILLKNLYVNFIKFKNIKRCKQIFKNTFVVYIFYISILFNFHFL